MDMVRDAADCDRLASLLVHDAAEKRMQRSTEIGVAQERSPVFGGEHRVNEDLGEGLRHGILIS
jgi:hypothetical protein